MSDTLHKFVNVFFGKTINELKSYLVLIESKLKDMNDYERA